MYYRNDQWPQLNAVRLCLINNTYKKKRNFDTNFKTCFEVKYLRDLIQFKILKYLQKQKQNMNGVYSFKSGASEEVGLKMKIQNSIALLIDT